MPELTLEQVERLTLLGLEPLEVGCTHEDCVNVDGQRTCLDCGVKVVKLLDDEGGTP